MPLDNGNQPAEPSLSEADRTDMEVFLGHMLGMLPVLGVHAFEQAPKTPAAKAAPLLTCKGKGVQANGYEASRALWCARARRPLPPRCPAWRSTCAACMTCAKS